MSPATPPALSSVRPITPVQPQLENTPATSPLHGSCGAGVFVGAGFFVAVGAGLFVGFLVGLGVLVGGTGVSVGGGVLVGASGDGVYVAVCTSGVLVGNTFVGVLVGGTVLVGMGVSVGGIVAVKVGLRVLVGVAVASSRRDKRVLLEQASSPISMVTTATRITKRFLLLLILPPYSFIRQANIVFAREQPRTARAFLPGKAW